MKIIKKLFAIFIVAYFIGCTAESEENQTNNTPTTQNDLKIDYQNSNNLDIDDEIPPQVPEYN